MPPRTNRILGARVLAEDRDLARRATPDHLRLPAAARHGNRLRLAGEELHPVGLDQEVDDERAARLSLAVQAMTAVHEEWFGNEPIADCSAGATTFTLDAHGFLLAPFDRIHSEPRGEILELGLHGLVMARVNLTSS